MKDTKNNILTYKKIKIHEKIQNDKLIYLNIRI